MHITGVLQQTYGYDSFRPGQKELTEAVLSGRDVMGIMPTGAGKSICYQIPSLMFSGLTIVISPLISLMLDQVLSLKEYGIRAAFLNSTLTPGQQQTVLNRAANGAYQIMYVAPERLSAPSFITFCRNYDIPFIAVDEAHCISQWGHAFRPDYLRIKPFIEELPYRPIVGAYTATATVKVREDIVRSLGLDHPLIHVNSFDRPNLYFDVASGNKQQILLRFLNKHAGSSGIVYCSTRKDVESICDMLIRNGHDATRYHAGLTDKERTQNQNDFLYDRRQVMVATNAFGMGIDKSNVSYVVHYSMPKNIESYYQEAGRAGRDGSPADCLLLYSPSDVKLNEFLIEKSLSENENLSEEERAFRMEHEKDLLRAMTFYAVSTECFRMQILRYFGENSVPCGHCGNCDNLYEDVDISSKLRIIMLAVREMEERGRCFGKTTLRDFFKGSKARTILDKGMDKLYGYGKLAHVPGDRIYQILDWAVQNNWLTVTGSDYPVIRLGAVESSYWTGDEKKITARFPLPREEKKASQPKADASGSLFEALRRLRKEIADQQHVPAFVIFSDATLTDMARKQPETMDQLLSVRGVGQYKAGQYGRRFIECIRHYKDTAG